MHRKQCWMWTRRGLISLTHFRGKSTLALDMHWSQQHLFFTAIQCGLQQQNKSHRRKRVEKGRTSVPCARAVEKTTSHYWLKRLSNAIRFGVAMDLFFFF